jgi:hypothetical protein
MQHLQHMIPGDETSQQRKNRQQRYPERSASSHGNLSYFSVVL